jgi:type VI secretion system secreted protein VgrG
MTTYTQADRPLTASTPLSKDALLLVGLRGHEAISQLFNFQLDLYAENQTDIPFEQLLGQPIAVSLALPDNMTRRYFHGICSRVCQEERDQTFTRYWLEMVPQFWLWTQKAQSRIFQQLSVPDILKQVLQGLDVKFEIQGTFHPRDYCVQYRETDFHFASRLMEEEGIYYFFKHSAGGHTMVLANTPLSHPDLPTQSRLIFEELRGGRRDEERVVSWKKLQELRTGKYTLWDHCFELPHVHLDGTRPIQEMVPAGKVVHKLKVGPNDPLEIYDYPGAYAQRFDGVAPGGSERPAELPKIFEDSKRTVDIRMQQEAVPGLVIQGTSLCRQMVSGHKFTLERHWSADGPYLLTSVRHTAGLAADYRSGREEQFHYQNQFTCIPFGIPFRPQRVTPRPFVQGTQTAVVVGPPGEETFTDKYGRVKVQFHWDRQGQSNADSSCWVRVAQAWAGKRWGASFWPRIGQEVVVAFLEGDADQPLIVGSVYNADQMPPYLGKGLDPQHANDNKLCGVKSNSTPGGVGFNEWRFDDTRGKEEVFVHAERNLDVRVKHDSQERVLHDRHLIVGQQGIGAKEGNQREMVYQDKHLHVHRHQVEQIEGNMELLIGGAQVGGNQDIVIKKTKKERIEGDSHLLVNGNQNAQVDKGQSLIVQADRKELIKGATHLQVNGDCCEQVDGNQSLNVGKNLQERVGWDHALEAGQEIHLRAGMQLVLEAGARLTLKGPGGFVDISNEGVVIQGIMVLINTGGTAGQGSGCHPSPPEPAQPPENAKEAQPVAPVEADNSVTGQKSGR